MHKKYRTWLWVMFGLTSCAQGVREDSIIWDHEWKHDIYNLLFAEVDDIDHMRYWVKRKPEYVDGSPHQNACIEVSVSSNPSRYYLANLHTYSLSEVKDCDADYSRYSNLVDAIFENTLAGQGSSTAAATDGRQSMTGDILNSAYGEAWISDDGESWILDNSTSCASDKRFDNCRTQPKHLRLVFQGLFLVNESVLTQEGKNMLVHMIENLRGKPVESILIYGIADSSGDYATNRRLADARANSVKCFLRTEGMGDMPILLRGSVENGLPTAEQRITQRRFMIEMKFNYDEK
ncbi:OmpA family protein [Shewanella sp. M16]|uniref:OmpA family protein n=1 Tax=Shewanella sp. M16 TaxID=2830837 RepID=UPI001BB0CA92|nr:OmpA family protein [Shewanella sp. M16]MBS0044802.1 OmpA family protein [Shewanella sp. M16]